MKPYFRVTRDVAVRDLYLSHSKTIEGTKVGLLGERYDRWRGHDLIGGKFVEANSMAGCRRLLEASVSETLREMFGGEE